MEWPENIKLQNKVWRTGGEKYRVSWNNRIPTAIPNVENNIMLCSNAVLGRSMAPAGLGELLLFVLFVPFWYILIKTL